jgi:hypothetical protein
MRVCGVVILHTGIVTLVSVGDSMRPVRSMYGRILPVIKF